MNFYSPVGLSCSGGTFRPLIQKGRLPQCVQFHLLVWTGVEFLSLHAGGDRFLSDSAPLFGFLLGFALVAYDGTAKIVEWMHASKA